MARAMDMARRAMHRSSARDAAMAAGAVAAAWPWMAGLGTAGGRDGNGRHNSRLRVSASIATSMAPDRVLDFPHLVGFAERVVEAPQRRC